MAPAFAVAVFLFYVCSVSMSSASSPAYSVLARTESGLVGGRRRVAVNGAVYASFRGVPYAKQPLGELRFKELQPIKPWKGVLNATVEGPICPQHNLFYGAILQPQGMSEACIHANIHVPIAALPNIQETSKVQNKKKGLPIFVFIHGGGFACGSGDADLHGPEYLIPRNVIFITFNYRLGTIGFLSLNSSKIPGNNGLRDQITLLHWVQRNARAFGGNPNDVTLGGQSAGSASAHLLTISAATKGLFKRTILMSGTGIPGFFSATPEYAQEIANKFLTYLGINSTDPEEIHSQLVVTPIENIMEVNAILEAQNPIAIFGPVVESPLPGVTPVIDDEPEALVIKGRGKDIPLIIGFTSNECETFRSRIETVNLVEQASEDLVAILSTGLRYATPADKREEVALKVKDRYFNGSVDVDGLVQFCSDAQFVYPGLKLAELRSKAGAPVYLYQFGYHSEHSVLEEVLGFNYTGAAHLEDLTYVVRVNSILGTDRSYPEDKAMYQWMTLLFKNFIDCSDPTCNSSSSQWPAVKIGETLHYQDIEVGGVYSYVEGTSYQQDAKAFIDSLFQNP